MSPEDKRTILVVDDDDVFRNRLVRALTDRGLDARGAAGANAAIDLATADSPELALVDLRMPDGSGLEVVRDVSIKERGEARRREGARGARAARARGERKPARERPTRNSEVGLRGSPDVRTASFSG